MKGRQSKKHGSIFKHFFAILTLLVILTTTLNLTIIAFIHERLFEEFLDNQELFIDGYATSIDSAFEEIENIFTYLQSSSEVEKRKSVNYFARRDYLENEKAIGTTLGTYASLSPDITEIFIYWKGYPYLYTCEGVVEPRVYHDNRFTGDWKQWRRMLEEQYDGVTLRKYAGEKKSVSYQNSAIVSAPEGISGIYLLQSVKNSSNRVVGTICAALSEKLINSIFSKSELVQDQRIFVLDQQGQIIASNRPEAELEEISAIAPAENIVNSSRYIRGKGLLSHRLSRRMGMEYLIFTPQQSLLRNFEHVFIIALLGSALSIALSLAYAYYQSHRMYRPFRGILNALGRQESDSQRDETDYMAEQVLGLLADNRSMNKKLESSSRWVLQAVLYKTIMSNPTLDDALAPVRLSGGEWKGKLFAVAVIRLDLPTRSEELFYTEYHDRFDCQLHARLGEWLLDALETRPDEYTAVLCMKDAREQDAIAAALHDMYDDWREQIPDAVYLIGISETADEIRELRSCYQQAISALRRRPVQRECVVECAHAACEASSIPFIPNDLEAQLRTFLEKGAREHVTAYVKDVLDRNWRDNIAYEAFLSVCTAVNRFLFRLVQNKDALAQGRLIHIDPASDVYSAQRCSEVVFSNLSVAADILESTQNTSVSFIDQAICYVNGHFTENINLDSVAQALGYSANHLSRNFKLKSGVNFTDYLNGKRIAYARELLLSSRDNLQDIAGRCGMSGANQLIRVFEKYEGVTPNEFRRGARSAEA